MTAFDKAWNIVKASPLEMAIADEYSTAEDYSPSKRRKMLAQMDPMELKDRLDDPRGDLDFRFFDPAMVRASGEDMEAHIDANFSTYKMCQETLKIYRRMLAKNHKNRAAG